MRYIKVNSIIKLFFLLVGCFTVQRYTLSNFYSVACALPYLLFVVNIYRGNRNLALCSLFIALLAIVDNGGLIYTETPKVLRYVIYVSALLYIIGESCRLRVSRLIYFSSFIVLILAITLYKASNSPQNFSTVVDDVFILLLSLFVFSSEVTKKQNNFNSSQFLEYVFVFTLSILVFELVNALIFFDITEGYLNYQSTKSIVVFPFLYLFFLRKYFLSGVLFLLTLLILVFYVTRMIVLSLFSLIFIYLFVQLSKARIIFKILKKSWVLFIFLAMTLAVPSSDSDNSLSPKDYKLTAMFVAFMDSNDFQSTLRTLDPVRYTELIIIYEQPLFNTLFGNGLGATYYDRSNLFSFVGYDDFAFSKEEIRNGVFFNFHDLWSDTTYRFGILSVVFFLIFVISNFKSPDRLTRLLAAIAFIFSLCAFWSKSGILCLFIFVLLIKTRNSLTKMESKRAQI